MIGNRVRIICEPESFCNNRQGELITGTLHKLDPAGATIWREHPLPEGHGNSFIPMHRIHEIIDLGRAP